MRMRYTHLPRIAFCLAVLALAACTSGRADLEQWVAQEKAKPGPPPDPLPVIKTFEAFEYVVNNLRDPFTASISDQDPDQAAANGPRPDQNRVREPLESFPLDGLRMTGTLGTGAGMEVLIKDPNNVIHRVRAGNYLGQNYGRVLSIAEDHVELVELVQDGSGGWLERQASIALSDASKK